jgi:hypothetical protein
MPRLALTTSVLVYAAAVLVCTIRVVGYADNDWLAALLVLTLPWSLASLPFLWSLIHGGSVGFFWLVYLAGGAVNSVLFLLHLPRRMAKKDA